MNLTWLTTQLVLLTAWSGYLAYSDAKTRRLPNQLTLGGLAVALCLQAGFGGWGGFLDGLAAAGITSALLIPLVLIRAAGSGDFKMMAAAAALIGLRALPVFLFACSLAGLVVMIVMLCCNRVSGVRLKHYFRCAFDWRYDRAAGRAALPPKDDRRVTIPFGIAIAIGAVSTVALELAMTGIRN